MRARQVLQKVLGNALSSMHAWRRGALIRVVEAALHCRRLTLTDLSRSLDGAVYMRTALKCVDRLLSNVHLHEERRSLFGGMTAWLWKGPMPVIVVDWSDLKKDQRWCLLRAAVPIGGRCLTVWEEVVEHSRLGNGKVQKKFLKRLRSLVPAHVCPILITDAGFRSDWFAAVEALGWHWIGRVRGRVRVRLADQQDWQMAQQVHALQRSGARDLGSALLTQCTALACRLVLAGVRIVQGRHTLTRAGTRSADRRHLEAAQGMREPWLLACSSSLDALTPSMITTLYRRRMQIEESFRDLKSEQFGRGFLASQSRKPERLQILLLIHAMAQWVAWIIGMAAVAHQMDRQLAPNNAKRRHYSTIRIGYEMILRGWTGLRMRHLHLHPPPDAFAPPIGDSP